MSESMNILALVLYNDVCIFELDVGFRRPKYMFQAWSLKLVFGRILNLIGRYYDRRQKYLNIFKNNIGKKNKIVGSHLAV